MIVITIAMLVPCILAYGINLHYDLFLFNTENVYGVRAGNMARETFLSSYFNSWLAKVALPVLMVYGMLRNEKSLVIFSIACLLYLFLVGAHKSVFLTIFVVLFLRFFKNYQTKIFFLLLSLFFLFYLSRMVTIMLDNNMLESIVLRRTFFDPAVSNIYYMDFFKNTPIYLSQSLLKDLITYPFLEAPEKIISTIYFDSPKGNANNGLISDAYMNFGVIGIFAYGFLFALLIKIFESIKMHHSFFGIFFVIIYTFISSFFLTTLLSHGVLLFLLIGLLFLKDSQEKFYLQTK
ncbi:MAG TPA: hypothetical protein VI757_11000 [Bacteroidia bacterium]|nr:hypothetical protein [Bacteroidia bacterium]